jgi:hypothetical protein
LDLGRLHETFRFISVTRSRTVSSTPWTGDQLVARTLLTAPVDCDDDGEVGGINDFGRGNRITRRKPGPTPLCPPQLSPGANPGRRGGKPATNRFSYGAAYGNSYSINFLYFEFCVHEIYMGTNIRNFKFYLCFFLQKITLKIAI